MTPCSRHESVSNESTVHKIQWIYQTTATLCTVLCLKLGPKRRGRKKKRGRKRKGKKPSGSTYPSIPPSVTRPSRARRRLFAADNYNNDGDDDDKAITRSENQSRNKKKKKALPLFISEEANQLQCWTELTNQPSNPQSSRAASSSSPFRPPICSCCSCPQICLWCCCCCRCRRANSPLSLPLLATLPSSRYSYCTSRYASRTASPPSHSPCGNRKWPKSPWARCRCCGGGRGN
jgi:hypothetical protein